MTQLADRLAKYELVLNKPGRPETAPAERFALSLCRQLDPDSGLGFDWILAQAQNKAKYIHLEQSADFAVFIFLDRSILVLLQSGYTFAVPSGTPSNIMAIENWLLTHGIGPATLH